MRLWSLHPKYLDRQGLTACWREALLAQAVLRGLTKGYKNHPQLLRFKDQEDPVLYIAAYLDTVRAEAIRRGYAFDRARIHQPPESLTALSPLTVTRGQILYEAEHLRRKLTIRSPEWLAECRLPRTRPQPHPLFRITPGPVASWEIVERS